MNERDVSKRYQERQRARQGGEYAGGRESWRGSEHGMGERTHDEGHNPRRWGAGEDWDERSGGRTQGHYAGDYESSGSRMGRGYGQQSLGRDEQDWAQGRREAQRWGEQSTYGTQGDDAERYGTQFGREHAGQYEPYRRDTGRREREAFEREDAAPRRYGAQPYGQGERSFGSHGYGSGREYRGYEGGEAGRRAGQQHQWERGYGEGYGLSSGYADEQAYGERYGSERGGAYASGRAGDAYARSYRGMGPKAYTRSDERVLEDVNDRLTEDDLLDASDISARCVNGVITLEGTVAERWMKHRAEDLADASSGVKQVDNRIQVQSQASRASGERGTGEGTASTQARTRQTSSTGQSTGQATGGSTRGSSDPNAPSQH